MIFSLDVLPARKGDCMLLHYGTKKSPGLIIIDGGPRGVYGPHLRPRLEQIRKARVKRNKPLQVDLLMVSHVDDDHIQGILELTRELREASDEKKPPLVQILSLWHNTFDSIIGRNTHSLTATVTSQFGPASISGSGFSEEQESDVEERSDEHPEVVSGSLKVLASLQQGAQLREDAKRLGLSINEEFGGELIIAKEHAKALDMGRGLSFEVVGPMLPEIDALRRKHVEWLQKLREEGKEPAEVLAAYVDKSVPNLSSLVLLAEVGCKKMLLTGDARGDKILEGLELTGMVKSGGKFHVELLKVPHHGSSNNLGNGFFERIMAKHYVFSGDGEHGNPERESLEMLFKARGQDDYKIHLTYQIDEIDDERERDWKKEQKKEKKRLKNPEQKVRPNWSEGRNCLRAFFDAHNGLEDKVEIVGENGPHLIDLLDPLTI